MLPLSLPRSLADLLIAFAPCFTGPTMRTFQALVAGFPTQPGQRTVTRMLVGARLAGRRHHDLAYRFFATARWSADQLGLVLLELLVATLVPAGAPLVLAVDDTLWRRSGRKLHGAAWHGHVEDRSVHLVGDAAYIGKPLQRLPAHVTVTARLRSDAALYQPAPPPTGPPRAPAGQRRPAPRAARHRRHDLLPVGSVQLCCYGKTLDREVLALRCLR
ncbi:MAG TPA: transposase [Actinomycetes bacterium]|jgi:hypothetical protein|nr:transposase [Actinomycetes bacterium]